MSVNKIRHIIQLELCSFVQSDFTFLPKDFTFDKSAKYIDKSIK